MTARRALVALAVVAGLAAGILYQMAAQRTGLVVAAVDISAARPLGPADIEVRQVPPDARPAGALTDASSAIGRFAKVPIWKGQLVVADAIAASPASFETGVAIPTGYRAVAVPVDAAHAVGGAIVAGARVDVIAVPEASRAAAGRVTEIVAPAALVIDVRGDQGGPFERHPSGPRPGTTPRERLGSVVVAVGPAAEMRIAERIGSSTFVLALVPDRP